MKTEEKDYSGEYNSTYAFVEQNNLESEANDLFGLGWEPEDDCNQISELLNFLGQYFYTIRFDEWKEQDDIIVKFDDNLKRIDTLEKEIKVFKENSLCWTFYDVQDMFECTDEEAKQVIDSLNGNEYVGGEVNEMMRITGNELGLTEKEED